MYASAPGEDPSKQLKADKRIDPPGMPWLHLWALVAGKRPMAYLAVDGLDMDKKFGFGLNVE